MIGVHFIGHIVKKIFYGLGGLILWIWAILMNTCMHKNNRTDIGYYLYEEFEINDNTGFSSEGIRLVLGIFTFILIIISLDFFD